jgi:hypothetical protein
VELVLGQLNRVHLTNFLRQSIPYAESVEAAVAYSQPHEFFDHFNVHKVPLKFYGLLDEEGGATSPAVLKGLLDHGSLRISVRLVRGAFHPKVIWWHGYGAYIGSANLTAAAWSRNVECGTFLEEGELEEHGFDKQLDDFFRYLDAQSFPLTRELYDDIMRLEDSRARTRQQQEAARRKQEDVFARYPKHAGLTVYIPPRERPRAAQVRFVREWNETLQLLRDLALQFERLKKRPAWVSPAARRSIHFDQFLHAYYYSYLGGTDEEGGKSGDLVERAHEKNRGDREGALKTAAKWWQSLKGAPGSEDTFIRDVAPRLEQALSPAGLASMTQASFVESMSEVHAFREHARQVTNDDLGLPAKRMSKAQRAIVFAEWLWTRRTASGATVADVLAHVLHGTGSAMEERLWQATADPNWHIRRLGKSILGESVGWALPDKYPARNDRTNKALRALGFDVRLFSPRRSKGSVEQEGASEDE